MIFVQIVNNEVTMEHHQPFHPEHGLGKTKEELELDGLLVNELPVVDNIPNKVPVLKYNSTDKSLYYEYRDIPLPVEEQVKKLEEDNAQMLYALMMGGLI